MNLDNWALILIGALIAVFYCVMGLGVTKMVSLIKSRPVTLFEVMFWPIILGCYSVTEDVA